jgi:hypothetical protein
MINASFGDSKANYEYIIFTEVNTAITEGKRLVYGADIYSIGKVKKWANHYETLCSFE